MIEQIANTDIYTIDADYNKPEAAAIHIVREGKELALIDTGTQYSIANVEKALRQLNASWADVRFIILTHVHLDHAGGAGQMMALANNAELLVHARGARHMTDPARLVAGSEVVYGVDRFAKMYGEIVPIEAERITIAEEGGSVSLAGRTLQFIDTPGHADHHICIWDPQSKSVFTGDTLGVSYQALRNGHRSFVMASSTPVQFAPEKLHASIDKVMALKPAQVYLTHYGALPISADWVAGLHEQIDAYTDITASAASASVNGEGRFETLLEQQLLNYLRQGAQATLTGVADQVLDEWLAMDAQLNAQGLAVWWNRQQKIGA